MSKFNKIILENLIKQTGEPILEQVPPQDPAAAPAEDAPVDPAAAPVAPPAPESPATPDEPAVKVNTLELARKALFVNPETIDQKTKGMLANIVTPENVSNIEDIISSIVTIETDVDTGGAEIDYNNIN